MARSLLVCVVVAFCAIGASAGAASDKTLHVEFFAHGNASIGEAEIHEAVRGRFRTMDERRPGPGVPKSAGLTNFGMVPTRRCAGSPFFPVWVGEVGGRIRGDIVFTFFVVSSPGGRATVRVWPDVDVTECGEHYRPPSASTVVRLPTGSGKVVARMKNVDFETSTNILVQVAPTAPLLAQGRILYDSADAPTSLSFYCTPLWGSTCAPYEE